MLLSFLMLPAPRVASAQVLTNHRRRPHASRDSHTPWHRPPGQVKDGGWSNRRSKKGEPMKSETITQRVDLVIRRHILEPGEALPWHTDLCHRFTVVVSGEALSIEYRDSGEIETFPVHAGMADWDAPQPKVHRGINAGTAPYEEVIIFFIDEPGMEPQPEAA